MFGFLAFVQKGECVVSVALRESDVFVRTARGSWEVRPPVAEVTAIALAEQGVLDKSKAGGVLARFTPIEGAEDLVSGLAVSNRTTALRLSRGKPIERRPRRRRETLERPNRMAD